MEYRYYLDEGFIYRIPHGADSDGVMQVMDAVTRTWSEVADPEFGYHAMWYGSQLSAHDVQSHRFPLQGRS